MWNHNGVQNDKTNMTGCMVISNLSSKRDYVSSQSGSARERERERGRCPMPQGHGAKLMTFLRHIFFFLLSTKLIRRIVAFEVVRCIAKEANLASRLAYKYIA